MSNLSFVRRDFLGKDTAPKETREEYIARLLVSERKRIARVSVRDGAPAALEFAKRTYATYRLMLIGPSKNYAKSDVFRTAFVVSCLVFRSYIRTNTI